MWLDKKAYKHFLLTRINVRMGGAWRQVKILDLKWLHNRFRLFDEFCYPSVYGQTCQNFKWIALLDINTPNAFREKVKKYAKWDNFIPLYVDKFKIPRQKILEYLTDDVEYLITTRIDGDDAICKDYIEIIQNNFNKQSFQFLNFPNVMFY